MFVAASTLCYASLPLKDALNRLAELEFTRVEIAVSEAGNHLKPSQIQQRFDAMLHLVGDASPVSAAAFYVELDKDPQQAAKSFVDVCRFAKQAMVTSVSIPASAIGTPFNVEIERLRRLQATAGAEGLLLSIKTQPDRLTQDANTAIELCQAVPGLGITLDPSAFIYHARARADFDIVYPHVYHVQLRDTSHDKFQTRVGQGEIEYGRLITQLERYNYRRALSVEILETNQPDLNHEAELRKLRLLLDSLV